MIPSATRLARCALPTKILIFDVLDVAAVDSQRWHYMPKMEIKVEQNVKTIIAVVLR